MASIQAGFPAKFIPQMLDLCCQHKGLAAGLLGGEGRTIAGEAPTASSTFAMMSMETRFVMQCTSGCSLRKRATYCHVS